MGTTWIGGTLNRKLFENAADTKYDEYMMIVTPLGYPSDKQSMVDLKLRNSVRGDERFSPSDLFFEEDFSHPMDSSNDYLEAVRWAPSAANRQPWRVVKDGNYYHFYLEHAKGYKSGVDWDVQKSDMEIALCHFLAVCDGEFSIDNPEIESDEYTEYVATVHVN